MPTIDDVAPDRATYRPHEAARVTVQLTNPHGAPFAGRLRLALTTLDGPIAVQEQAVTLPPHGTATPTLTLTPPPAVRRGYGLDASLLDTYFHMHEVNVPMVSLRGEKYRPTRNGALHPGGGPTGIFHYRGDQYIFITVVPHQWPQFVRALGMSELASDPRFRGWWPSAHPDMRSFLGVPIVSPDGVIGSFYLTHKEGAERFGDEDQELIELLASHAAIAITNARLYERSRELSILEERNRLALELHDAVSQKLFGLVLTAESAETLLERDGRAARAQIERLKQLSREALDELRSLILELRPPALARDGLCGALRKHVEVVRQLHPVEIELRIDDAASAGDDGRDQEVFRIAQEALQNALRHARANHVELRLGRRDGQLSLEVRDDGTGFRPDDPELRSRRLGLTSMEERAARLGGRLEIHSAPGEGTDIRLEVAARG